MENVTQGMIRSGWKGYSDSFDPWMGRYNKLLKPNETPTKLQKTLHIQIILQFSLLQ